MTVEDVSVGAGLHNCNAIKDDFDRKFVDVRGNIALVTTYLGLSLPISGFVWFYSFCSHVEN